MRHASSIAVLLLAVLAGCGSSHSSSGFVQPASTAAASTTPTSSGPAPTYTPPTGTVAPPVVGSQAPAWSAQLVALDASEFAGGWGIPPAIFPPPTPPPPTLTVNPTFSNATSADMNATDPTIALMVSFSDTATGPAVASMTAPLSASIAAGAKAQESVTFTLTHTYSQVWVTCRLVKLDAATGRVVGFLSAPSGPTMMTPPIAYPV